MPRIRTIKPEFWTDGDIVRLSKAARLFYIGLWNFADDNGVQEYDPLTLKLRIFPKDNVKIEKLTQELVDIEKVIVYEVKKKKYILCKNLVNHQVIERKRKTTHPLPEDINKNQLKSTEISLGREGKGREKEGKGKGIVVDRNHYLKIWNKKTENTPLPILRDIKGERLTHLKTRNEDEDFKNNFEKVVDEIISSDFLSGRKPSKTHPNFKADFDWLIRNDTNYIKILEGKYKNKDKKGYKKYLKED